MKKNDYLKMLIQDNETEKQPKKELYEAVIECTIEALSQTDDNFEIDHTIGCAELFEVIRKNQSGGCVSPFKASELIAAKLGVSYTRPIDKLKAKICGTALSGGRRKISLDDL